MTFSIHASVPTPVSQGIGFKDLHRLACFLMEESGTEAHDQQNKTFTIWPLLLDEDDDRKVEITIHSLTDNPLIEDQIHVRMIGYNNKKPNLGPRLPLQHNTITMEMHTWSELLATAPQSSVSVELLSPMFYSRSGEAYPLPDPILVHRQLARRWNECVPSDRMRISDELSRELNSLISIRELELSSVSLPELQHRMACTGQFSFILKKSAEIIHKEWFSTLWQFAQFSGLGAMTTQGLGAIAISFD